MSLVKLKQLQKNIEIVIEKFENDGMYGSIPYLEEAQENIEHAIEEYKLAYDCISSEDQDND